MTAPEMAPWEILDKAADVVEQRGLHQGEYFNTFAEPRETAPVCALGAINVASGRAPDDCPEDLEPAELALADHLGIEVQCRDDLTHDVGFGWNDADGRTAEEVAAALRAAARDQREAGR